MEATSKMLVIIAVYLLSAVAMSSADYCVWGMCNPLEYCCGDNKCCPLNQYDTVFIVMIILGVSLIIIGCFICIYYKMHPMHSVLSSRFVNAMYVLIPMKSGSQTKLISSENSEEMVTEISNDTYVIQPNRKIDL